MSGQAPSAREVAEAAAEAAIVVPGVVALDSGPLRTKVTYGSGGRVEGVTVRTGDPTISVTVHVDVAFGERIPELAEQVDAAVRTALTRTWPHVAEWEVGLDVVDITTERPAPPSPTRGALQ